MEFSGHTCFTKESCAPHGHKFEPALMRLKLKLAQGDKDTSRKLLITIKVIFDACMCFVLKCSLHWVLSQYY